MTNIEAALFVLMLLSIYLNIEVIKLYISQQKELESWYKKAIEEKSYNQILRQKLDRLEKRKQNEN